jgi:hypothetical protein
MKQAVALYTCDRCGVDKVQAVQGLPHLWSSVSMHESNTPTPAREDHWHLCEGCKRQLNTFLNEVVR